ncbi:MAG: hypothetical protein QM535_22745 [Limnohabitans sp.]|nr:hypothetical protein [Limnohabitans sp.]
MSFSIMLPTVVNISCSFQFNCELDLEKIIEDNKCKMVKSKFKAVNLKIDNPKASFNIFKNGKIILCGIRNQYDIMKSIEILKKKINVEGTTSNFKINNKVYSGWFGSKVNLVEILNEMNKNNKYLSKKYFASYEMELFPALIIHKLNSKQRATIFRSGKYIITGNKLTNECLDFFNEIKQAVVKFRIK